MIREAFGVVATVCALLGILAGSAEAHPILMVAVVAVSAWGVS